MGLTNTTLRYLADVLGRAGVRRDCRLLDIGLSELRCHGDAEALLDFLRLFDPQRVVAPSDIADLLEHCYLHDVCARFGLEYTALEVCGERPFQFFDFNRDTVSPEDAGRYDLVLNLGTSEHILNQYGFFNALHTLCRPGGMLLHVLPFSGYLHHGFFNYQPKLFFRLAEQNDYAVLDFRVADEALRQELDSIVVRNATQPDIERIAETYACSQASLHVLFRKRGNGSFRPPSDHVFIGVEAALRTGIAIGPDGVAARALLEEFPDLAARTTCLFETADRPAEPPTASAIPVRPAPRTLADLQAICSTLVLVAPADPADTLLASLGQADIVPCVEAGVLRSILTGRVACMPAGGEVETLLRQRPELRPRLACLFDNNPARHGDTLAGLPIEPLPDLARLRERVDVVVVASEAHQLAIRRQLEPFREKGVVVLSRGQFLRMTQDL